MVGAASAGADETFLSIKVQADALVDMTTTATLTATCTITEIVASNDSKGIDGRLKNLKPWLQKPPFGSWNSFTELGEQTVTVEQNKPLAVHLTNGTFTLLLKQQLGPNRLQFDVTVDDTTGKRALSTTITLDNPPLMLADVLKSPAGTYILALQCK
jgi:hypothetical protein